MYVLLTVKDKKEEKSVPSSYLESFANTLSRMTTNWERGGEGKKCLTVCYDSLKLYKKLLLLVEEFMSRYSAEVHFKLQQYVMLSIKA